MQKLKEPKREKEEKMEMPTNKKLRTILTVLIQLQDIHDKSPAEVLDRFAHMLAIDPIQFLSADELDSLRRYTYRWGIERWWEDGSEDDSQTVAPDQSKKRSRPK